MPNQETPGQQYLSSLTAKRALTTAFIGIGIALISLIAVVVLYFTQRSTVAYVKVGVLMEKYQGMVDAREAYKVKSKGWEMNVDTLAAEVQRSLKDYEKGRIHMSPKERQLSEQLLNTKQQQFIQYRQALQQKAQEEDKKMTEEVISKVNAYLERYGKTTHYSIIFGANASGNILYGTDAIDLTDKIVEGLNKEYNPAKPSSKQ